MRSTFITLVLLAVTFMTGACNTMQGMGQDIENGGKKLKNSAEENK